MGCNVVVLLSHLGMPTDYEILSKTTGIDVCISGHTHNRLNSPIKVGDTLLIQSGCHGSFIGRLDLELVNGRVVSYHHQLLPITQEIKENPAVKMLVDSAYELYQDMLQTVAGKTETLLCRDRAAESTMDDFLLHAISHETGRKLCFSQGWRYGAPIPPSSITEEDLYNIVPMNPVIVNVDLKGLPTMIKVRGSWQKPSRTRGIMILFLCWQSPLGFMPPTLQMIKESVFK